MTTTTSYELQPLTTLTSQAQQELAKWQEDRKRWEETLPVMGLLSLNDEERIFLQAHLIWHCVAGHLTAPLVASPHRWHLACDHEVNSMLLKLGISLPFHALLFPTYFGRSAIEVYQWLSGHPRLQDETSLDVHPAALWAHSASHMPDLGLIGLWRRRAHLAAQEAPAIPSMVAEFCLAR